MSIEDEVGRPQDTSMEELLNTDVELQQVGLPPDNTVAQDMVIGSLTNPQNDNDEPTVEEMKRLHAEHDRLEAIELAKLDNEKTNPEQPQSQFEIQLQQSNEILDALMARIGPVNLASPWCNLFIYGLPGVGKSTLLGTAPGNLIIDVEDGAKSIRNHPNLIKANNPQSLEYRSVFQVEQLVKFIGQNHPNFDFVKVLSVDSFTSLADRALVEWVRSEASRDASRNPWLPVGTDYNINTQHMKQLATDIHDLDRHVVFLGHADEVKDESTGRILIRPSLTPKLAKALVGLFDMIGFLSSEIGTDGSISNQRLQIYPTDKVMAKTRIGGLPPIIDKPTLPMIFEAYEKSRQEGTLS